MSSSEKTPILGKDASSKSEYQTTEPPTAQGAKEELKRGIQKTKEAAEKGMQVTKEAAEKGLHVAQDAAEKGIIAAQDAADKAQTVIGHLVHRGQVTDAMTYPVSDLSNWGSLTRLSMTVWLHHSLWLMFAKLFMLSMGVALTVLLLTQDPGALKVSKFTSISQFLNAFVGLLLGFFMSASVKRWWSCADGFLVVVDAIRNLQIQLYALGVPEDKLDNCLRFGVVSAWILHMELHIEAMPSEEKEEATEEMWGRLLNGDGLDPLFAKVKQEEWEILQKVEDPSGLMWLWVGTQIGHLAQEGMIPPMASPTYGRIMNLAQDAHRGMRIVRSSISVQAPFIYVQMLASLVHLNNIINALSFGMTAGASIGTMLASEGENPYGAKASVKEATADAQTFLCSFFFSCFGPFIYQALLEVSICIAQPFSSTDGEVPTQRLLKRLERDLHDGKMLAHNICWEAPKFGAPPKK